MAEPDKQQSERNPRPLCIVCGASIAAGNYCGRCIDRGFAPCETCEGLPLDIEEG